jgi:peptidoglycan/xylan/chitin deacetylase (PgdA/CDA1 family)
MLHLFKFFILLSLTFFVFSSCKKVADKDKVVNIIFRYDDVSVYTSSRLESKILTLFKEHNISLTFAVIPYRCTGEATNIKNTKVLAYPQNKANLLKKYVDNGTLEVALHGYSHQTVSNVEWTEFKNVPYEEQLKNLRKGKKLLEGFFGDNIHSFVPPFNTYDSNTVKALETLNIQAISANPEGIQPKDSKLTFISNTVTIDKIKNEIQKSLAKDRKESFIVVMFHDYNLSPIKLIGVEKAEVTLSGLDILLSDLKKQKNIHFMTLSEAQKHLIH